MQSVKAPELNLSNKFTIFVAKGIKAMKELIFSTNNAHKLGEVQALLEGKFALKTLRECGITEDIPETAETLEGNALFLRGGRYRPCSQRQRAVLRIPAPLHTPRQSRRYRHNFGHRQARCKHTHG